MSIKTSQAIKPSVLQKQWRAGFPRRPYERSRCYDVDVKPRLSRHALIWTENSTSKDSRPTKTLYRNPTKPAGLIRITTYDSSERLNFFDLWNLLRIWDCRPFSVLKTLTGSRAEKSSKCHKTWFRLLSLAYLRSIKHFRIASLF